LSILGDLNKIPNYHQENSLYEYVVNSGKEIFRRAKAFEFVSDKNNKTIGGLNQWVAFRNRYYCAIVKPNFEAEVTKVETKDKHSLGISWDVSRETSKDKFDFSATVYLGPEDRDTLKSFGLGFEKIKRFYNWAIFEWPAKFIYFILHGIHKFIPLWGICILLISIIVYLATYPLTFKSMTSMRKMQQIQPEVAALRDKFKDNPQQMNAEMMAIYHRYNINPLSGCLPMLLQMPVFIGLYQVLWRDVSFKGQKFKSLPMNGNDCGRTINRSGSDKS
jgi:YidC/Oxa1 family membrane protein insertase